MDYPDPHVNPRFLALCALGTVLLFAACGGTASPKDDDPIVTFNGETCVYDGPDEFVEGGVTISFDNQSDDFAHLVLIWFTKQVSFDAALVRIPEGTTEIDDIVFHSGARQAAWLRADAGRDYRRRA